MGCNAVDVRQVVNLLELLEFFAEHGRPATLAEIARHFGWPRSSTFNLLGTLVNRGYLYEPRARDGYYPSPSWLNLIQKIDRVAPLPTEVQSLILTLSERTGETTVLAAISGMHAVYIAAVEPEQSVRYAAAVGKTIPLHTTATGRALLSQLSETERSSILRKATFERRTPATLMSVAAVENEIELSLKRGSFEGIGEYTEDLAGIAVPLKYQDRHLAVLVAGPLGRILSRKKELTQIIQEELARLSGRAVAGDNIRQDARAH